MKRFFPLALLNKVCALALVCAMASVIVPPASVAAGASAATSVAVFAFENSAGAPTPVIASMSDALYRGVSSSDRYAVAGGGVLPLAVPPNGDALSSALTGAAKLQTKELIVGNVLRYSAGTAVYRLSTYRVSPLQPINSRVFAYTFSGDSSESMAAAFAHDIASLDSSRTATGTIYSLDGGVIADVGTAEGFHLGQRFHVTRNGRRLAEAQITKIEDISGQLTMTDAAPGYHPAVGDRLQSDEALASPSSQIKGETNTFNPVAFILAIGAVVFAISHHGSPAPASGASPGPSPSIAPFAIAQPTVTGSALQQPITFVFPFTASVNLTAGNPVTSTSLAYYTLSRLGAQQFPLSQLGTPNFTNNNSTLTITSSGVIQPGDKVTFTFLSTITDVNGRSLAPSAFSSQFGAFRRPL